ILMDRKRRIARKSLRASIGRKRVVTKAVQAAVHTHPKVPFAILKQTFDPILLLVFFAGMRHKMAVFKPAKTPIRARPEIPGAILPQRADKVVRKPVAGIEMLQSAVAPEYHDAVAAGQPKI